jgi:hypothetical protein
LCSIFGEHNSDIRNINIQPRCLNDYHEYEETGQSNRYASSGWLRAKQQNGIETLPSFLTTNQTVSRLISYPNNFLPLSIRKQRVTSFPVKINSPSLRQMPFYVIDKGENAFVTSFGNMSIPPLSLLPSSFSSVGRTRGGAILQQSDRTCVSFHRQERISLCRSRQTTVGVLKSKRLQRGEEMCDILLSYCILQLTDRRKGMLIMLPFALP